MRNRRLVFLAVLASVGSLTLALWGPDEPAAEADSTKITSRIRSRIELGRRLFHEPALSNSRQRSCASCHSPDHGFSDPDIVSRDDVGTTRRHSQTIIDAKWNPSAHWDGEFASVEELVTRRLGNRVSVWQRGPRNPRRPTPVTPGGGPVPGTVTRATQVVQNVTTTGPVEHPFRDEFALARSFQATAVNNIIQDGRYEEGFRAAFGNGEVSLERVALAIAAYCYACESTESPFDRYRAGDKKALSQSAKRGMLLFIGRAGCAECHTIDGTKPLFTDFAFHNTGITYEAAKQHPIPGVDRSVFGAVDLRVEITPKPGEAAAFDRGRGRLTQTENHERAFKTPTLRDVAQRAPYMHNGALATLEDVVRWYAAGCGADPDKERTLRGFRCNEREVQDLVAFLESLSGDEKPGTYDRVWHKRATMTTVTILTGDQPLADVDVKVVPVGGEVSMRAKKDEDPDGALTLRTSAAGKIRFKPRGRTHVKIVLPDDLPTIDSPLVPDTCRQATIRTAIHGEMQLVVTFPDDVPAPPVIVAEHTSAVNAARTTVPRTLFRRAGTLKTEGGRVERYRAWVRGDLPRSVVVRFPGLKRHLSGAKDVNLELGAGKELRLDLTTD